MKNYLFSYLNTYRDKRFILSRGKNRKEAKERIPFPCTYVRLYKDTYNFNFIDSQF